MTDNVTELPARAFAAAWLNVSRCSSDDEERPSLYRSVAVELIDPESVRLVATDSYMLLCSSVRVSHDTPGWCEPVEDDEVPYRTVVAIDENYRLRALLKWAWKATKDDETAMVRLSVGSTETDEAPTLMPELARMGLTVDFEAERITLPIFDGPYPDWRGMFADREPCATGAVAYNPQFLARLDGLHTLVDLAAPVAFDLAGPIGMTCLTVDVRPSLAGGLMPTRVA